MFGLLLLGRQYLDGVDPLNGFVEDPLDVAPRGPLRPGIITHNPVEDAHEQRGEAHDAKSRKGKGGRAEIKQDGRHRDGGDEFPADPGQKIREEPLGLRNIAGELGEKFAGGLLLEIGQGQVAGLIEKIGLQLLEQIERKDGADIPAYPLEHGDGQEDQGQLFEQGQPRGPKTGVLAVHGQADQLLIVARLERQEHPAAELQDHQKRQREAIA